MEPPKREGVFTYNLCLICLIFFRIFDIFHKIRSKIVLYIIYAIKEGNISYIYFQF